jgi:hypothetical protein
MEQEIIGGAERRIVRSTNPYTIEKLFGVAFLGALSGVLIYYIYNQLGEDTRKAVKEAVITGVKGQMAKFAEN